MEVSLGRKGRGRQGQRTHLCMLLLITFAIWAQRLDQGFPSWSHPTHIHTQAASIMHTETSLYLHTGKQIYAHRHNCVPLQASMISQMMILIQHGIFLKLLALYAVCIQTWHRTHYLNSSLRPSALPQSLLNTSPDSPQIAPLKLIIKVFGVWDCNSSRPI